MGLVKNSKHETNLIVNEKMNEINFPSEELKSKMSIIQDIVHNKAISFHRKIHREESLK